MSEKYVTVLPRLPRRRTPACGYIRGKPLVGTRHNGYLTTMDQHEIITKVLCEAGGCHAEHSLPDGYAGKRADVVFVLENLIAEVKSFTSDRRQDPQVATKLGEVMERNAAFGGPIVFGTVNVRLHDLPTPIAEQALRVVGARVRKEVTSARGQITATRAVLNMPDAYGLIVFVSPPERLGNQTTAWLINDALKHSAHIDGLDGAMVIETPLGFPAQESKRRDTFSSLWSISGRAFPDGLAERIGAAWGRITLQPSRYAAVENFVGLGGTE